MSEKLFGIGGGQEPMTQADLGRDAGSASTPFENIENSENEPEKNALHSGFDPRPSHKANIKRHIFSVPKEDSQSSHIISPIQDDSLDEERENIEPLEKIEKKRSVSVDYEKTRRVFTGSAFVKRRSFSDEEISSPTIEEEEDINQDLEQLVLDGFDGEERGREIRPAQSRISEKEMEAKLKESRRELAKEFTLEQENLPYTRDLPKAPDNDIFQLSARNRRAAHRHLSGIQKKLIIKIAALSVIGIVLLLLDLLGPTSNYMVYVFINFALLIAAAGFGYSELMSGVNALKDKRPNLDTGILLLWIVVILQNVVFFSQPSMVVAGLNLFNGAAVLLSLPAFIAKYLSVHSALRQINLAASKELISVAARIPDENSENEIGRGVVEGEPLIQYNAKIHSLDDFIHKSLDYDPSSQLCKYMIPVSGGISLLIAIIVYFSQRDIFAFATAFSMAACATIPASVTLSMSFSLFFENMKLARKRSGIVNYEAAEVLNKSNCIILSDKEIFPSEKCNVHGILPFNKMAIDDAILFTAAMLVKSEGPLGELFYQVVMERNDLLPPVESLVYEDKLGLSAWIDDKKVLVGTLDHLRHHNVKLPEGDFYSRHCTYNRKPLFLAVEGILAALFVVSYDFDESIVRELKSLTASGVTTLIHVSDPNVTEDFVEDCLGLKPNTVKVMNQKTSEYYKLFRNETRASHEAENFHEGTAKSFLRLIRTSFAIESERYVAVAAALIASLLGLVLVSIFLFSKEGIGKIGNTQLVLYHLFWGLASLFIPKIISFVSKR